MVNEKVTSGAIEIRDVGKSFGKAPNEVIALEKINLTIQPGEFVSIVGPSGCGKTTLIRSIVGLETPTSGAIFLDKQKITGTSYERGLVFQDPTLFPWLDVYHNVATGLVARKVFEEKKQEVTEFLKLVGLSGFEKSYPHQLSGGMAQRVALARALLNHPKVLLLDEPLGALDAFTRMQMQDEILRIWKERQTTMVLITHDVDEAVYMSDRIIVMSPRPGRIRDILSVELSRPRARNNPELFALRSKILEILHFAKSPVTLESMGSGI